jgi:hypothetical protein
MGDENVTERPQPLDISKTCPACDGEKWTDFFVSRDVPVDVGSSLPTEAEALAAHLADINLAYCYSCGLAWNRTFNDSIIGFKPGYDAGLHHSPLVRTSVDGVVDHLIERYELRGKNIIEIGCGGGYFLRRLCERGGNLGTGIDPTVPRIGIEAAGSGRVQFIRDFYSKQYNALPCDFLCCQSVLEDISSPMDFLKSVSQLGSPSAFAAYFEVFNGGRAFEQQETWSIHYEQCIYYSLDTFRRLLQRCGFQLLDAGTCPGNAQYIFVEAKSLNGNGTNRIESSIQTEHLPPAFSKFAARHKSNVNEWRSALADSRAHDRKIVLWGSGGKGVSFLNAIGKQSGIRYVVDINPSRHGRYIPGSAHQIVPPSFLSEYRPDVVILSNPAYESEIRQQIARIGLHPELWLA